MFWFIPLGRWALALFGFHVAWLLGSEHFPWSFSSLLPQDQHRRDQGWTKGDADVWDANTAVMEPEGGRDRWGQQDTAALGHQRLPGKGCSVQPLPCIPACPSLCLGC